MGTSDLIDDAAASEGDAPPAERAPQDSDDGLPEDEEEAEDSGAEDSDADSSEEGSDNEVRPAAALRPCQHPMLRGQADLNPMNSPQPAPLAPARLQRHHRRRRLLPAAARAGGWAAVGWASPCCTARRCRTSLRTTAS